MHVEHVYRYTYCYHYCFSRLSCRNDLHILDCPSHSLHWLAMQLFLYGMKQQDATTPLHFQQWFRNIPKITFDICIKLSDSFKSTTPFSNHLCQVVSKLLKLSSCDLKQKINICHSSHFPMLSTPQKLLYIFQTLFPFPRPNPHPFFHFLF